MSWSAMTSRRVARLRWVLAFMAAWAIVFSMSLAAGVAPAYANSDSATSAAGAAPVASLNAAGDAAATPPPDAGTNPAKPVSPADPMAGAKEPSNNATAMAAADAATPVDAAKPAAPQEGTSLSANASTPVVAAPAVETAAPEDASTLSTPAEITEPSAYSGLGPAETPQNEVIATTGSSKGELLSSAGDPSYPGDDGADKIFIGLSPIGTESYDVYSTGVITRDPESNAVYVDIKSEVGRGVDLAVAIDYMRIDGTSYGANASSGASVTLPTESLEATPRTVYAGHLMTSLYAGMAPLGQGSYRADVASSENPGMSSGDNHYDVNARCFEWDYGAPVSSLQDRINYSKGSSGSISLSNTTWFTPSDDTWNISELYFETSGRRVFTAQFTYLQEFRETKTDEEGEYTLVSYLLYVSNPVIFRIDVEDKQTIGLSLSLSSEDGNPVNYDEGYFNITIRKEYHGGDNTYYGGGALCSNWEQPFRYKYATDGVYFIEVRHSNGLYEPYVGTVAISFVEYQQCAQGGWDYIMPVTLRPVYVFYTVTFYAEDGLTILPVDGQNSMQYRASTFSSQVRRPTPPIKEEDENGKYVFDGWRMLGGAYYSGGDGVSDVYSDANYVATYRLVPTKNEPKARFVYATGGLFGKAKPAGVASYQLTSNELSEEKKATIVEEHSGMIASSAVLGVFGVGITQYNDDGTTSSVTEGVGDLNLSFELDGVADGTKVRVLQIHETGDPENPEEVIEHNNLVVEGGAVSLTLDDKLSTFIILEAASSGSETTHGHVFDDGSDDMFIGLAPMPFVDSTGGAYYGADGDHTVYVPVHAAAGEGIRLGVLTDYIRVGDNEALDHGLIPVSMTITEDSTDSSPWNYALFSWYYGDTPLAQGTYYSDLEAYKKATGSTSGGSAHALPTYESVDINAMAYIWQSAMYGYDNGSGTEYYDVPNRMVFMSYNGLDDYDGTYKINVGSGETVNPNTEYELFFPGPGTRIITAQVTFVKEIIESRTDEHGDAYNFVSHILYASVPVQFIIDVEDAPRASLEVHAVDQYGDPVPIDWSSGFEVYTRKQFENPESTIYDDYADPNNPGYYYTGMYWQDTIGDFATAGKYKVVVSHRTGLYEDYVGTFMITDDDITTATAGDGVIVKTITLQSIAAPTQYSVKFLDDFGNLIETPGEKLYNENTHWSEVTVPTTKPVSSKPDTDDIMYVFWQWHVQGTASTAPAKVTSDLVMVPYFKEVPKKDVTRTPRVYASGGLFTKAKDPSVASHRLTATPYDLSSSEAKAIIEGHSGMVGSKTVVGLFDVGITRYMIDGTEESVTEGVGDLSLTFDLSGSGVADGTKVKVLQIHKKDASSAEEYIEHEGTVEGGSVSITLDDKLSTFIIMKEVEAQGDDPVDPTDPASGGSGDEPTDPTEPTDPAPGDNIDDDVDIEPTNPSNDDSSTPETPASDTPSTPSTPEPAAEPTTPASNEADNSISNETSGADEPATRAMPADDSKVGEGGLADDGRGEDAPEVVKAGPSADGGKTMPQTGDAAQPLTSALIALLLMAVAGAACAAARAAKHQLAPKK